MDGKIKKVWSLVPIIAGMILILGGCFPNMNVNTKENTYVSKNDPIALIEFRHKQKSSKRKEEIFLFILKVDGQQFTGGKVTIRTCGNMPCLELAPGLHTLEVSVAETPPINLNLELNAIAGHNYRIQAYEYDEKTISLYVEDIDTHEVVSGRRPELEINQ